MKKWWVEEFFFWLEPVGDRKWSRRDILWMPVSTPGLAKWARGPALILSGFAVVLWALSSISGFFTPGITSYWALYTPLWILVTWGLLKMRPEAAMAGFVLSIIWVITVIMEGRGYRAVGEAIYVWLFVHAIRGTFACQRFAKLETDATSKKK